MTKDMHRATSIREEVMEMRSEILESYTRNQIGLLSVTPFLMTLSLKNLRCAIDVSMIHRLWTSGGVCFLSADGNLHQITISSRKYLISSNIN